MKKMFSSHISHQLGFMLEIMEDHELLSESILEQLRMIDGPLYFHPETERYYFTCCFKIEDFWFSVGSFTEQEKGEIFTRRTKALIIKAYAPTTSIRSRTW